MILLKRDEIKITEIKISKTGKKQDIPYKDLANHGGNKNTKMIKIEKNENILLYSALVTHHHPTPLKRATGLFS